MIVEKPWDHYRYALIQGGKTNINTGIIESLASHDEEAKEFNSPDSIVYPATVFRAQFDREGYLHLITRVRVEGR